MPYEVIYGPNLPIPAWFDTLEAAIDFAEHQPKNYSAAVWEHTDDGAAMVWPTTDQAAYIARRYSKPTRTGPITLADAIKRSGISVPKLAKEIGITFQQIYKILSDEIQLANMSARNVMSIAETLNVDIRDLLDGERNRLSEKEDT